MALTLLIWVHLHSNLYRSESQSSLTLPIWVHLHSNLYRSEFQSGQICRISAIQNTPEPTRVPESTKRAQSRQSRAWLLSDA